MIDMKGFNKGQIKTIIVMGAIIIGLILFIVLKDNGNFAYGGKDDGGIILENESISRNGDNSTKEVLEDQPEDPSQENIKIYITGEVRNPGVIEIPYNFRLNEAVDMIGGFLPDADLVKVNLAIRVQDEGMYFIPKIGEDSPEMNHLISIGQEQGDTGEVNINTADQSQLETLPRIGPVLANSIIDHRDKNGLFKDKEDIKQVSGVGEKTFEGLKDLIVVK
ncbi:MAG TPA: helix-hairpin-helix domain-containing protein [Clostridia bacterium]|nr:helix-hairpin-helix domain-containing protein [Clostridia bacterium]